MPAPFAAISSRINQAVQSHLTDSVADFGDGLVVDVIFNDGYVEAIGMVAGDQPTILVMQSLIPDVKRGSSVYVRETDYSVAEYRPDGNGNVLLVLEK